VATKQDALTQVPVDQDTEEVLTGTFIKGVYWVAPVQIAPMRIFLTQTTRWLDQAYQDSLAVKADTEAAIA
jgi:hypothetical protein